MIADRSARELHLFIENDGDLYRQQYRPIIKNLATKKARGEYKHDLAVKAFGYLAESGAKKYAKQFGSPSQPWHKMFDVPVRRDVAEELTRGFEAEHARGEYDHLLPKKYQKKEKPKPTSVGGARKKQAKWSVPEGISVRWAPTNNAWFALWPASAPLSRQQVLKIAGTEDMDAWLKDTYGREYGRGGGRPHGARKKSSRSAQIQRDIDEVLARRRY